MSKLKVQGNPSGSGVVTLLAPNINSNITVTLPSTSGDFGTGTAKAWVNFDGTGTPSIRDSINVSSVGDIDVGYYRINFTTNMGNSSYAVTSGISESGVGGAARVALGDGYSTSSLVALTYNNSSMTDYKFIAVAVFGD